MKVELKLLHPYVYQDIADPSRDVFGVWIYDHPTCAQGKGRRVAYSGPKTKDNGNVCFIAEHKLAESEQAEVVESVAEWQKDEAAIAKSRVDREVSQ